MNKGLFFVILCLSLKGALAADSSQISVPTTSPKYASAVNPPPPPPPSQVVNNEQYGPFPMCPATLVCPDINNKIPAGTTLNCPAICTLTRSVGIDPSSNTITGTVDAVCPTGYVAINAFNMGKVPGAYGPNVPAQPTGDENEIINGDLATTGIPFPIPSMASYNNYASHPNLFTCTLDGTPYPEPQQCITGINPPHSQPPNNYLIARSNNSPITGPLQVLPQSSTVSGVAQYTYWLQNDQTAVANDPDGVNEWCEYSNCGASTRAHGCFWGAAGTMYWFQAAYQFVRCTINSGFITTSQSAPLSVTCARSQPTWLTPN